MRKFATGQKVKIVTGMFKGMTGEIKPSSDSFCTTVSQDVLDEYYGIRLDGDHPSLHCHEDQFEPIQDGQ